MFICLSLTLYRVNWDRQLHKISYSLESCDVYKDGKPLFFDADHLSGYGNEVLKSSFSNMIFQNFNTSEYAENSMVGN